MEIFYDRKLCCWYQTDTDSPITFGGERKYVVQRKPGAGNAETSFQVRMEDGHIGPLVGILTAAKPNGAIAGNGALFMEIQKKLISFNGISFIFTLEGVEENSICGYAFLPPINKWIKIKCPFPDLVYNRIPFRSLEQQEESKQLFSLLKEKKIPFFNPCFIDKQELHSLMLSNPFLRKYLPRTIAASRERKVFQFLKKYKSIYLKPAQSAKGNGIYRLKLGKDFKVKLEGIGYCKIMPSFSHFWDEWQDTLHELNYLVQEEIIPLHYQGKRFDFRVLAHFENGGYTVTGIGIRQSQDQEITTHIPSGGKLLPYDIFQTDEYDQLFHMVVNEAGQALSERYGFFGEFSIDACTSPSGRFYIFEINSKPMSFDEPEIEEQRVYSLCRIFLQLTNFQK